MQKRCQFLSLSLSLLNSEKRVNGERCPSNDKKIQNTLYGRNEKFRRISRHLENPRGASDIHSEALWHFTYDSDVPAQTLSPKRAHPTRGLLGCLVGATHQRVCFKYGKRYIERHDQYGMNTINEQLRKRLRYCPKQKAVSLAGHTSGPGTARPRKRITELATSMRYDGIKRLSWNAECADKVYSCHCDSPRTFDPRFLREIHELFATLQPIRATRERANRRRVIRANPRSLTIILSLSLSSREARARSAFY